MTKLLPSELLADPKHWTKDAIAKDQNGNRVSSLSNDAVSFCLLGACFRCNCEIEYLISIIRARGFSSLAAFNDDSRTTYEDILSVLEEAGL